MTTQNLALRWDLPPCSSFLNSLRWFWCVKWLWQHYCIYVWRMLEGGHAIVSGHVHVFWSSQEMDASLKKTSISYNRLQPKTVKCHGRWSFEKYIAPIASLAWLLPGGRRGFPNVCESQEIRSTKKIQSSMTHENKSPKQIKVSCHLQLWCSLASKF